MSSSAIYCAGHANEMEHHVAPLRDAFSIEIRSLEECLRFARAGDLCLVFNEYFPHFRGVVEELIRRGCGTLYAIDGILEWRNSWEFPHDLAVHWVMRPILSHKVACIGRSQARVLESWGNLGKCEVVGVPRFDKLLNRTARVRHGDEPWTVLIMTAKTPGFTAEQIERTRVSLIDLKRWFDAHPQLGDRPIRPRWRVTAGMDSLVEIPNELRDTTGEDLAIALQHVDAVITTPSTAMLEGMLQGLPVALLDYHNCPHYVPAAWTISAREHLTPVVEELLAPPAAKLLYQQTLLHDALECQTPATPRMVELVEAMRQACQNSITRGVPIKFPSQILDTHISEHQLPEESFDLARLFPEHPVFGNLDRALLQTELGDSLLRQEKLQAELSSLRLGRETLARELSKQIRDCEHSLSFRVGRAVTWPLRAVSGWLR